MENVLKQHPLDLRADRMSTHSLANNQLRRWLAAFAYLLLERLRAWGLAGTELAHATVGSVRRGYVQLCSANSLLTLFRLCHGRLRARAPASGCHALFSIPIKLPCRRYLQKRRSQAIFTPETWPPHRKQSRLPLFQKIKPHYEISGLA
jgi:hypothetical protein